MTACTKRWRSRWVRKSSSPRGGSWGMQSTVTSYGLLLPHPGRKDVLFRRPPCCCGQCLECGPCDGRDGVCGNDSCSQHCVWGFGSFSCSPIGLRASSAFPFTLQPLTLGRNGRFFILWLWVTFKQVDYLVTFGALDGFRLLASPSAVHPCRTMLAMLGHLMWLIRMSDPSSLSPSKCLRLWVGWLPRSLFLTPRVLYM